MSEVGEEVAELLGEHLDDAEGRAILEYAAEDDRARFELSLAFSRCVDDKNRLERELEQAKERLEVAHRAAATLEAEVAKVRHLHRPREFEGVDWCWACDDLWPCETAKAVYLTGGDL